MELYNLIGRQQGHDVNNTVPLSAEKNARKCFTASILACM